MFINNWARASNKAITIQSNISSHGKLKVQMFISKEECIVGKIHRCFTGDFLFYFFYSPIALQEKLGDHQSWNDCALGNDEYS